MSRSRAWRRDQKRRVAESRRKLAEHYPMSADYIRGLSANELQKRHPFDCGRRCLLCHMDKLLGGGRRRAAAKRVLDQEKADA